MSCLALAPSDPLHSVLPNDQPDRRIRVKKELETPKMVVVLLLSLQTKAKRESLPIFNCTFKNNGDVWDPNKNWAFLTLGSLFYQR